MFFTGVLYLLFEGAILRQNEPSKQAHTMSHCVSRVIMGMQVGKLASDSRIEADSIGWNGPALLDCYQVHCLLAAGEAGPSTWQLGGRLVCSG